MTNETGRYKTIDLNTLKTASKLVKTAKTVKPLPMPTFVSGCEAVFGGF